MGVAHDIKQYRRIGDSAWKFLIRYKVATLPLDVADIAERSDWLLMEIESNLKLVIAIDKHGLHETCDAFTCIHKNQVFIFYKHTQIQSRWLFTIAHEFGHIVLLHFHNLSDNDYEKEANMFAARILMPMCVLKECLVTTAKQISELCGTSITASEYRLKRLEMLERRKKFYTSPLECQVAEQFTNFIKENKNGH